VRSGGALGLQLRCTSCAYIPLPPPRAAKGAPPLLVPRKAGTTQCAGRLNLLAHQRNLLVQALASVSAHAAACRCRLVRGHVPGCNDGARVARWWAGLGAEGAGAAVTGWPHYIRLVRSRFATFFVCRRTLCITRVLGARPVVQQGAVLALLCGCSAFGSFL
jgi:hypothetical protein